METARDVTCAASIKASGGYTLILGWDLAF
jgi:hypothetical protein